MDEICQIATIVEDHVQRLFVGPIDCLMNAPNVLLVRFTLNMFANMHTHCTHLPRIHGRACSGNSGSGVILRTEDIARRPLHLDTSKCGLPNNL
jgi:hypothetical protein